MGGGIQMIVYAVVRDTTVRTYTWTIVRYGYNTEDNFKSVS